MEKQVQRRFARRRAAPALGTFAWPLREPLDTLIFLLLAVLIGLLLVQIVEWRMPPRK